MRTLLVSGHPKRESGSCKDNNKPTPLVSFRRKTIFSVQSDPPSTVGPLPRTENPTER